MLNLKLNKLFKLLCRTFFVAAKGNKSFKWEKPLGPKLEFLIQTNLEMSNPPNHTKVFYQKVEEAFNV